MSLRVKTTLILAVTMVALLIILLGAAFTILLPSYEQLERDYLRQDTARVVARLNNELRVLDGFLLDWASWSDTYDFVVRPSSAYLTSNLVESTFVNSRLTAVIIADNRRQIIYQGFYDHEQAMLVETIPQLEEILYEADTGLLKEDFVDLPRGLIDLPHAMLFMATRPILDSEEVLPPRGTMLMIREMDEALLAAMAEDVQADVSVLPWVTAQTELSADTLDLLLASSDPTAVSLLVTEGDTIHSYSLLTDIFGQPVAVVKIDAQREIYQSGQNTLLLFVMVTVGIGLLVILLMLVVLTSQVIDRVVALEQGVVYVREQADLTHLVPAEGNDEIAALGAQINRLLTALDLARHTQLAAEAALLEERNQLEERVQARTRELAHANKTLRALDASKTQFINDISHEFRTPVTNLRLYIDLWQRGDEAQKARYMHVIEVQIMRLIKLTESVMRLAELEFAPADEPFVELDLTKLVTQMVAQYADEAQASGLTLTTTAVSLDPIFIHGRADLLRTLLGELLDNSLRYSEQGTTIQVNLSHTADMAHIEIIDEGMGITADDLAHVQERFYRGKGASQSNRPGIGVGLTIAGQIVAMHRGQLTIDSMPDEGTAVVVRLPLATKKRP